MKEKLFEVRQVILFIGNYPNYNEKEVMQLIKELGFSPSINPQWIKHYNAKYGKNLKLEE
jgi:hypothetical protein